MMTEHSVTFAAYKRARVLRDEASQLVDDLCSHTDPRTRRLEGRAWQRYERRRDACDRAEEDHWGPLTISEPPIFQEVC